VEITGSEGFTQTMTESGTGSRNGTMSAGFFISYTAADTAWAEWVGWVLEEVGARVVLQAWDFAPGSNFVLEMQKAAATAERTIAILSPDYLKSQFAMLEWAAGLAQDPESARRSLIPVRVRDCALEGMLRTIVYVDLVGTDEVTARKLLIEGVSARRGKPELSPEFPGEGRTGGRAAGNLKPFPGKLEAAAGVQENVPRPVAGSERAARSGDINRSRVEFHADAQNYERVDFVSSAEMLIDQQQGGKERGVYAQVEFVERLYVECPRARIEFGVRRAYISVGNEGPGELTRADHLRTAATRRNAQFVSLHEAPTAVSICINPDPGKTCLAELALPPTPRENYLCQIATATPEVVRASLHAELRVSLDSEGLYLADDIAAKVLPPRKKQIEAIMTIAAKKNDGGFENGEIRRSIEVRERSRGG
jgi:hypothetical protein